MTGTTVEKLAFLKDLWSDSAAKDLESDPLSLLRYRSNLLGADLRITNFAGGNTSSKIEMSDPFTGKPVRVLAVKGSGGDLGSITNEGFALLYLDKLEQLMPVYRGEAYEDDMVSFYPPAAFGHSRVAASIDTPLHGLLPFPHVDHLHPDWAIALAASANGKQKLAEFNKRFHRKMVWLPWQRPGFELGLMLRKAVADNPGCDGIILGSHGLFTWGQTQRECYWNSIKTIDEMGEFVADHQKGKKLFGGTKSEALPNRREIAAAVLPALRGALATTRRAIGHYADHEDALAFANSEWGEEMSAMGTSCPDHFLRTRIRPMFVDWDPKTGDVLALKAMMEQGAETYRRGYAEYYEAFAEPDSPKLRDANPSVVIVPGLGLFSFGKNKKEARITSEFFINAIHVMSGAAALDEGTPPNPLPQAKAAETSKDFRSLHNYVALPLREAFRIEYWALEEAKLQRMPPEQEFSRKILVILGGGSGIGREAALKLAKRGSHLCVADRDQASAQSVADEAAAISSKEFVFAASVDIANANSLAAAYKETALRFGGIDGIVNTAAIFPVPGADGKLSRDMWMRTFDINITGNYLLADGARSIFNDQRLPASIVLTSSANAVVPKHGSEAYDVSKSAVNQLVRELAIGMAPLVRVNGIAPATVVAGSTMFPRDRVISSLSKYQIPFSEDETTEELRTKLAQFYAKRTLTREPILPGDCAEAIVFLAGDLSAKTTGHVIPVDGGLPEAFLR
ncbi:MAG TPA: bifunctional rhamnulose-1-phosphate aldolase/short-chain dehydrogenase [Bryobacteraceae bacterium]|jgi:rhamnose utilization protein RhaD (predicted bifunctional aldolase and dehydrogenase)/NAD(P)-dependent dehydrogenase (short-subunit alcohol dehydrogenase family)|nr:bifunctional rhamnulose-1-phosphate aldolase/short-chain dehydrogenase [Bryobacteraceae bacterium]